MKFKVGKESNVADAKLAPDFADNSGIGVHYIDEYLKSLNKKVEGEFEVKAKRKGLKVMLKINGELGTGLMRRLTVSNEPKVMLQAALKEAASNAGYRYALQDGCFWFEKV